MADRMSFQLGFFFMPRVPDSGPALFMFYVLAGPLVARYLSCCIVRLHSKVRIP